MSVEELKKVLKSGKVLFGTDETLKSLRRGSAKKVFVASDVKPETLESITHYAKLAKVELINLDVPSDEVALLCKKAFPVSVLSC